MLTNERLLATCAVLAVLVAGASAAPPCVIKIGIEGQFNTASAVRAWEYNGKVANGGLSANGEVGATVEVCPGQRIWIYNTVGHALYLGEGKRVGRALKASPVYNMPEGEALGYDAGALSGGWGDLGGRVDLKGPEDYPDILTKATHGVEIPGETEDIAIDHLGPWIVTPPTSQAGANWFVLHDAYAGVGLPLNVLAVDDPECQDLPVDHCPEPQDPPSLGCLDCPDALENECTASGPALCEDGECSWSYLKKQSVPCECVGSPPECASGGISPAMVAIVCVSGVGVIGGLVFFGMRDPKPVEEDPFAPFATSSQPSNIIPMGGGGADNFASHGSGGSRGRSRSKGSRGSRGSRSRGGSRSSGGKKRGRSGSRTSGGGRRSGGSRGRY